MAKDILDSSGSYNISNEEKRMMRRSYKLSQSNAGRPNPNKSSVPTQRAAKAGGRAQPRGTAPKGMTPPPRTGPSSGGGGQSARYNRLTGGLKQHGR